jgi:ATP-dependent Lon protease
MQDTKKIIKRQMLPLLPLRGITVFPFMTLHFDVGRAKSVKAIEEAMQNHQLIFLATQIDASCEEPEISELYNVNNCKN